jgi:outer membrane protein TolC
MIKNSLHKENQSVKSVIFLKIKKGSQILIPVLFMLFLSDQMKAQQVELSGKLERTVTMEAIINKANKNSLEAFKAKQQYGANYWRFESYNASILPKINLEFQPISYNNSIIKRYDYNNNIDVYKQQQTFNSYTNISVNQIIRATGATVFLNSNFNRLASLGDVSSKDYSATPVSFGFFQPIMAFNNFKWEHKIAPLQFEYSKKEYIYKMQEINIQSVTFFFNWVMACKKVELAKENSETTQKLFKIGNKRYELGSIEKDDVLNLELDVYNANTYLIQSEKELEKAVAELKLFLRDDTLLQAEPELPELISNMQIDIVEATTLAEENNPEIFNLKIKKLEGLRNLDRAIKENRFDLSLTGSYGLNQYANTVKGAYSNLQEQQMIAIQFKMPILDWGERKGNIKTARLNKEVEDIGIQKEDDQIHQELALKVTDFNLQKQLVSGALRSGEISKSSYEVTEKRFLSGSIDLLRLSSARKAWQLASENYINSLYSYWRYYYEVQQLTLYDFINKKAIKENLEGTIDN